MKLLKFTSIGLLSVLAFQNIAFACDAYCSKRFSVKYTVTVPPSALIVGDDNPNIPSIKFPQPGVDGSYQFWIDRSALDADFGNGTECQNSPAISVIVLSKGFEQASKFYKKIQEQAKEEKAVQLTLVGDNYYLKFHKGRPFIKDCSLFIKSYK